MSAPDWTDRFDAKYLKFEWLLMMQHLKEYINVV